MTVLDFAPPSLLTISNYDAWRVEFKRCQARATIAGYKRDKTLLEAVIATESKAVETLREEWQAHEARALAEGRSKTFMKALVDEYSGSASKHKREQYAAEYALKALEVLYAEAKRTVNEVSDMKQPTTETRAIEAANELIARWPDGCRIAIVGSRGFNALDAVKAYVAALAGKGFTVVSGGAAGVDYTAEMAAMARNMKCLIFPVPKVAYTSKQAFAEAAKVRNKKIVDTAHEVVAFWDGKSSGTAHSMEYARNTGKRLTVIRTVAT